MPDYLNPGIPKGLHRVSIPIVDASDETLAGFGYMVANPNDVDVEIVRWPAQGWRPVDSDSGDEGGTTEGEFFCQWKGDVLYGRNAAVGGHYVLGYATDPPEAREDHHRDPQTLLLWHANYHPDGGQLFFPQIEKPFLAPLALPGDDIQPEDFVCFRFAGRKGFYIHPGVWHEGIFALAGEHRFFDKQGAVHARVSVDFPREFECLLEIPLGRESVNAMSSNSELETTFFEAIKSCQPDDARALVAEHPTLLKSRDYASFGGTALNVAVFRQDREMVNLLIDLGADLDALSDWWAGPWNAVQCALNTGQIDLAEHLVQRGASVGVHEAAGLARIETLNALLDEAPQRVAERGGDGCTPMHFAGSTDVVDVLLDHGANIDARDVDHYSTPAQYLAKSQPEVARYLFDRGATPDVFSAIMANDPARLRELIAADASVLKQRINRDTFPPGPEHEVDNILTFTVGHNATPLHAAGVAERLEIIDLLVAAGIDVDARGGYDESTALHLAAWNDSLEVARKLVAAGADIEKRSGKLHNNTPVGWAIVAGSVNVFNYLIDQGAQILNHYIVDAQASARGDNLPLKCVPMENYQQILSRLHH